MLEKRLGPLGGGDCTIANLKAQIGQLTRALEEAQANGAKTKVGGKQVRSDSPCVLEATESDLGTNHQANSQEIEYNLGMTHMGNNSPGCRNLNRLDRANFQKSAVGSRDLNGNLDTTHQGPAVDNLGTSHQEAQESQ